MRRGVEGGATTEALGWGVWGEVEGGEVAVVVEVEVEVEGGGA